MLKAFATQVQSSLLWQIRIDSEQLVKVSWRSGRIPGQEIPSSIACEPSKLPVSARHSPAKHSPRQHQLAWSHCPGETPVYGPALALTTLTFRVKPISCCCIGVSNARSICHHGISVMENILLHSSIKYPFQDLALNEAIFQKLEGLRMCAGTFIHMRKPVLWSWLTLVTLSILLHKIFINLFYISFKERALSMMTELFISESKTFNYLQHFRMKQLFLSSRTRARHFLLSVTPYWRQQRRQ